MRNNTISQILRNAVRLRTVLEVGLFATFMFTLAACSNGVDGDEDDGLNSLMMVSYNGTTVAVGSTVDLGAVLDPGPSSLSSTFSFEIENLTNETFYDVGAYVLDASAESILYFSSPSAINGVEVFPGSPRTVEVRYDLPFGTDAFAPSGLKTATVLVTGSRGDTGNTIYGPDGQNYEFTIQLDLQSGGQGIPAVSSSDLNDTGLSTTARQFVGFNLSQATSYSGGLFTPVGQGNFYTATALYTASNNHLADGNYRYFIWSDTEIDSTFDAASEQVVGPIDFTIDGDTLIDVSALNAVDAYYPTVTVPNDVTGDLYVAFLAPDETALSAVADLLGFLVSSGSLDSGGGTVTTSVWTSPSGMGIPPGTYDIAIWVDSDSDGTLDGGDRVYRQNDYVITAANVSGGDVLDFSGISWTVQS